MFDFKRKLKKTKINMDSTTSTNINPSTEQKDDHSDIRPFIVSGLGRIRYEMEHHILRDYFFADPDKTVSL